MRKVYTIIFISILIQNAAIAQVDTISDQILKEVNITGFQNRIQEIKPLLPVQGTFITSGKKSTSLKLSNTDANIVEKTGRQIFAKVPGAFIYDMDGSGNQINFATRGLDPHRSWEYNVRQNGVSINSDIYGYPASHYSPPLESIEKIEILSGSAGLQYGPQFGGMINYITKTGDTTQRISYAGIHSKGSYGLWSTFHSLSGKVGKISYYTYFQKRNSDGYRKNATSNAEAEFASITYEPSDKLAIKAELGRSTYLFRIPGALTDSMFHADPRASTRNRNYFSPDIYVPSITLDWKINENTKINYIASAVLGDRSSVQFVGFANTIDKIDANTLQYAPRQVDIDNFNSYTSELRMVHAYKLGKTRNSLAAGIRYINNNLHRRQLGTGTNASDYDLALTSDFKRNVRNKTQNVALFAENLFQISSKFHISPGFRIEMGETTLSGKYTAPLPELIPVSIKHQFPLFGISFQYNLSPKSRLYAGFSQAYRPVIFADLIAATALDIIDENIKDAKGYNAELGINGSRMNNRLYFDLSLYLVDYKNRIGSESVVINNANYILKTNTGNTITKGAELLVEYTAYQNKTSKLLLYTSVAYSKGEYTKGNIIVNGQNLDIKGNRLETNPAWISRSGVQYYYKTFQASLLHAYVDKSFSDAQNTEVPSANGSKGIVPAYQLTDFNASLRLQHNYTLKIACNNIFDVSYFTKRPTGYPGVGVWSSDGRSIQVSLGLKF